MKNSIAVFISILMLLSFTGCGASQKPGTTSGEPSSTVITPEGSPSGAKTELTVAAASDLTKAFTEVGVAFEKVNNVQ